MGRHVEGGAWEPRVCSKACKCGEKVSRGVMDPGNRGVNIISFKITSSAALPWGGKKGRGERGEREGERG